MGEIRRRSLGLRIIFSSVALLAGLGGFYLSRTTGVGSADDASVASLRQLSLPDAAGRPQALTQWEGKARVINFWATWCAPCREEMPILSKLATKYAANNLQIVGIAVDSVSNVRKFSEESKIDYPLLVGGFELIDLTRKLGNKAGALPYTVILDGNGHMVTTHLGAISETQLEKMIRNVISSTAGK